MGFETTDASFLHKNLEKCWIQDVRRRTCTHWFENKWSQVKYNEAPPDFMQLQRKFQKLPRIMDHVTKRGG